MSKNIVVKLKYPRPITLYMNGKNPNIYYYFRKNKKSYRGSTRTTDRKDAITLMSSGFVNKLIKGKVRRGKKKIFTIEDIGKKFLRAKEIEKLSPNTLSNYKGHLKFLSKFFKSKDIDDFGSEKDYIDYTNWRLKYYKNKKYPKRLKCGQRKITQVGNATVNRECRLLVSILRFSQKINYLQGILIPPYKLKPENKWDCLPTKEEYTKLKKYWKKRNLFYWYIISFIKHTGVRYPSELNRIRYKDVNIEKNSVLIRNRKSKDKNQPLNTPVPLVGKTIKIIEKLRNRNGIATGEDDLVFVNDDGIQIKNIRKAFKNSLVKCDINPKLSMYSFRHLYATRMVKRPDIPLKMVSFTLGHSDTKMVDKVYSHLRAEDVINTFKQSEKNKNKKSSSIDKKDLSSEMESDEEYQEYKKFIDLKNYRAFKKHQKMNKKTSE